MKLNRLFISMLAVASIAACQNDEPLNQVLEVSETSLNVASSNAEATFTITSNQDWTITPSADWVSVDPVSGAASEEAVEVKVTAEDNQDSGERTATLLVKAGTKEVSVTIAQVAQDGSESNPYIIKTAADMVAMRTKAVLDGTTYFRMEADVDMASVKTWTPVNFDQNFTRQIHFDGNNKTITNFAPEGFVADDQTTMATYPSLFGVLYGSCKNLTIKNSKIIVSETTPTCGFIAGYVGTKEKAAVVENVKVQGEIVGGTCLGGLGGNSNGPVSIKNCEVDVVISSNIGTDLGGLLGKVVGEMEISDCNVKAVITSKVATKNRVGGIIGWNSSVKTTITNTHVLEGSKLTDASGRTAASNGNFGGFIGFGDTSNTILNISKCSATITIESEYGTYNGAFIGGLGYASTAEITDSWSAGSVSGSNYTGGFIGAVQNSCTITRCSSSADVVSSGQRVSGLVGTTTQPITITDSYSTGNVSGSGQQIGGILGYSNQVTKISNCFATGNITSETAGTGGIVGTMQVEGSTVSKCIAWNKVIDCKRTANDKWAPGAVVGAVSLAGNYDGCYRRADMELRDAAGAMVLVDHDDVANGLPAAPSYSEVTTQRAYHGKAAAADATVSSVAKTLGWSETVWDLSKAVPTLK